MCRHFTKLILHGLVAALNLPANYNENNRDQRENCSNIQCKLEINSKHECDGDSKCHYGVHQVTDARAKHTANGGQIIGGSRYKITYLVVLEIIQFELL